MKGFIVIVILLVIGGFVYLKFVDPKGLEKISGEQISKSSNKFGMTEKRAIGSFEKLDSYLVDQLKLRKDSSNPREIHYINDVVKRKWARLPREVVIYLDFTKNIKKITANTIFNKESKCFDGADTAFMSEYWTLLTGNKNPNWKGKTPPTVGNSETDAKASYSAPGIKATYIWKTSVICYRTLTVEKTDS